MGSSRAAAGMSLSLSLALGACGASESRAEAAPPPEPMSQAGATALRDAFVMTYMTKNADGVAAFYAEDAVKFGGRTGTIRQGRDSIRAGYAAMLAAGRDSLGLTSESFEAGGDLATDRGTFVMRILDPRTREASYERGSYMVVFARQADGGFRIAKDSTWDVTAADR